MGPSQIIFDSVAILLVVISSAIIAAKARRMYGFALQKGIKYFSNAFLFFMVSFSARLIGYIATVSGISTPVIDMVFHSIGMYAGGMGGFYLAYSLVWRRFEKDRVKRCHYGRLSLTNLFFITLTLIEVYLITFRGFKVPVLFYAVMLSLMIYAFVVSLVRHKHSRHLKSDPPLDPHFGVIALAFVVYFGLLAELFVPLLWFHYLVWVVISGLFLFVLYQAISLMEH